MGKLLNNKYVIATMVLVALVALYFRVAQPIMEFMYPDSVGNQAVIEDLNTFEDVVSISDQASQLTPNNIASSRVNFSRLRWNENIQRDPFREDSSPSIKSPARTKFNSESPSTKRRLPGVSALVFSDELKFAVIDGEIYQEGDDFEEFKIRQISERSISLLNESKNQWHRVFVRK